MRSTAGLALVLAICGSPSRAPAQDEGAIVPPDSAFKSMSTMYTTSYDRDQNRGVWMQSLGYGTSTSRSSFNITGTTTTMEFFTSPNKSTVGSIDASLNMRTVGSLLAIITGSFDMSSFNNGSSGSDGRDNRINFKLQQQIRRKKNFQATIDAYSEFEQKQDRSRTDSPRLSIDYPYGVDSTEAGRDSSFTNTTQQGVHGDAQWTVRPGLLLHTTAQAYRTLPSIVSFSRSFVHPNDSTAATGGSYALESIQRSHEPTGNTDFNQTVTYSGLRKTNIAVTGQRRHTGQSYFDKQRATQETLNSDNTLGTLHVDTSILPHLVVNTDASLARVFNRYAVNKNFTQLTHDRKFTSSAIYLDPSTNLGITYSVDRNRTEQQANSNGVNLNRILSLNASRKVSRRLAVDALASASLVSDDYESDKNDRDVQHTFVSFGFGYMLAPTCSTTVHVSRAGGHTVYLDPSLSSQNAVTTTYQVNATLRYAPNRNFSILQAYLINADYRILDFVEQQNHLARSRRIDTDIADTLFSAAFVHLTHNFVFLDQGTYARFEGDVRRLYQIASNGYQQTLTATAGYKIVPGVVFSAVQSLFNQRSKDLVRNTGTLQNTWRLNAGIDVTHSFGSGLGLRGAVRHIDEYAEHAITQQTRPYWIAGVTVQKPF